jgi:L-amino acid N-acyltransferase YncA
MPGVASIRSSLGGLPARKTESPVLGPGGPRGSGPDGTIHARAATPADAEAIARIYNQGIADRVATFETRPRSAEEVARWFDGVHPVVAVERSGERIAFASTSSYRPRECYAGVAEFSVYVDRSARGKGVGRAALEALLPAARGAGLHKLVSRVFLDNAASLRLLESLGFRQVGVYRRHAQLEGLWRDVVIVELLL